MLSRTLGRSALSGTRAATGSSRRCWVGAPASAASLVWVLAMSSGLLACGEDGGSSGLTRDDAAVELADGGDELDASSERERARDRLTSDAGSPLDSGKLADAAPSDASADAGQTDAALGATVPTTDLALWLRADRGVSEIDGRVSLWADQSAAGADAVQLSASSRPRLIKAAAGAPAALEFDGVDDFLKLPPASLDFSTGVSIFVLAQSAPSEACTALIELSNGPEIDDLFFGRFEGKMLYEVFEGAVQGSAIPGDSLRELGVVHSPSQHVLLRQNGETVGEPSAPLPRATMRSEAFVGKTLYAGCPAFAGRIVELLLYTRALGDRELLAVEEYLRARSGLISAPAP